MSNFQNLVINRRSIRKYKDEEIGAEAVKTIIETALMSPSSKNKMPWEFIVVEDRQTLAQLKECKDFGTKGLETCPLAVVVAANPETSDAWIEDASVATLMMQLQAADLGLGSCWIQVRDRYREDGTPAEEFVRNILEVPDNIRILCIVTFGFKDEIRKPYEVEKCKWEKVHIAKWKASEE